MNDHVHSDELMHYGVLGMKWGVRKAQKTGTTYKYKSRSTKKWEKQARKNSEQADLYDFIGSPRTAAKYRAQATRASKIADRSRKHDEAMFEISKKAKVGNVVVTNVLLGPWGNKTYNSLMVGGASKGAAIATTVVSSAFGLTPISAAIAKNRYIKDIE